MICISIAQRSWTLALVDLFNAGPRCDLLEVRLDRLNQLGNLGELLARKPRPVILSCRRAEDGGEWLGQEEDRLELLRQCVVAQPDYVELELDIAEEIPPSPHTKRVIAYTNLMETPTDLPEIYRRALTANPDVIKLTVPARTPEEVWPVVQILAKPAVPTVVMGVGKPGIMLALLSRRIGAPWVYAALEQGMEAYYGQPTVHHLETVYHYRAIERTTPFVGVAGFEEWQTISVALLNAAFASLKEEVRCLPVEIGDLRLFRKVLEVVKAGSAIIDAGHQATIREVLHELKPSAQAARAADFITHQDGQWQGHHLLSRAVLAALAEALKERNQGEISLQGRTALFVGINGLTAVLATRIHEGGGIPILAGTDPYEGQQLAQVLNCRFVHPDDVPTTPHDLLVRCDGTEVDPNYLKPEMTVLDLSALPRMSPLSSVARERGCCVVAPERVFTELTARQVRAITGKEVGRDLLDESIQPYLETS
jgi:3-dehydroquinate dehydratase/shikimate dehydrogenase